MVTLIVVVVFIGLILWFLEKFLRVIEPTKKGVRIFLKKRTDVELDEGLHICIPNFYDWIEVNCKRITETISIPKVFTAKDKAEIIVTFELTWQPSDIRLFVEVDDPIKQLNGMIAESVRSFASDANSPPSTWSEAVEMNEKFARMVVARIMGFIIPRYETGNTKGKHKSEADMTNNERQNKIDTLEQLEKLRTGSGDQVVSGLGLTIRRFNITEVEPNKALAESLKQISKEEQEKEAEKIEASATAELVIEFLHQLGYTKADVRNSEKRSLILKEIKMTIPDILRNCRVERGKSTEENKHISFDIPQELLAALKDTLNLGG